MTSDATILATLKRGDVEAAKRYLTENIREDAARKAGAKSSEIAIIKRVAREYQKSKKHDMPVQKIDFDGRTYYIACDGYKLFLSENSYGYRIADLRLEKAIPDYSGWKLQELSREKAAIVKAENKTKKEKDPVIYEFEDGMPLGVNPEYLLDAMDFIGTTKAYVDPSTNMHPWDRYPKKCVTTPIVFHSPENHRLALVMPINISKRLTNKENVAV